MHRSAIPKTSTLVLLAGLALVAPRAASPGILACSQDLTCQVLSCRAPASGAPVQLWGELQPVDLGRLPGQRDSTDWNEFQGPYSNLAPHWMSIDMENGWLFAALNFGLEIWDARGPLAAEPALKRSLGSASFPVHLPPGVHGSNPINDVDAPPGHDALVALSATNQVGLAVFNAAIKASPRAVYGDHGKDGVAVYATTLGQRHYAFMATAQHGLLAYDLSAAENNLSPCVEITPGQQGCGVYLGKVGSRNLVQYVDGAGSYVALSSGNFDRGLEIWDVSDPANPVLKIDALGSLLGVHGVTLWQRQGRTYLAVRVQHSDAMQARIYDLTCLDTGCTSLGAPLWTAALSLGGKEYFVTHSVAAGGRDFLYFGNENRCAQGLQNEWLFDVTNPAQARDVTPPPALVNGELTGYWGWYYRRNPTGFNRVTPRVGLFGGKYFYRAAYSLLDIHELATGDLFHDGFESGNLAGWSAVVP